MATYSTNARVIRRTGARAILEWIGDDKGDQVECTLTGASDLVTDAAHGLSNGNAVMLSNSGGALPTELTDYTGYYVINQTASTFQLALTPDGAVVEFTGDGTGTHYYQLLGERTLEQARVWGYNLINGRLQSRFGDYMPFTGADIPDALKDLEDDFATWWLSSTNQQGGEAYRYNYEQALKRLEALAAGEEALISDGTNLTADFLEATPGLAVSTTISRTPIFSRDVDELNTWMQR